ncbi:hypothetical protein Mp_3g08810 [Marchantia polymorpha subsp. ruderalis]|uniref:Uncharacterized protein n=2 Tax=Marchantia polymorpha TaxID=3197 RepID=A0AAF6AYT6_MARPO|nr:hypothetical protein MARPO_0105s0036 [Marchantia polymorpha]BBN04920.1 hypothetical protein Mp_3g08810 [Marchantia polymorpha subsp. ruderalis]|eukprot:PTQ31924.1 hypothetical protein MARPO_0105s0036 [Marchantia polymorpha]
MSPETKKPTQAVPAVGCLSDRQSLTIGKLRRTGPESSIRRSQARRKFSRDILPRTLARPKLGEQGTRYSAATEWRPPWSAVGSRIVHGVDTCSWSSERTDGDPRFLRGRGPCLLRCKGCCSLRSGAGRGTALYCVSGLPRAAQQSRAEQGEAQGQGVEVSCAREGSDEGSASDEKRGEGGADE